MGFCYKYLSGRISNKGCFNIFYFLMSNDKFCQLQYFSSACNSKLGYRTCKPLKLLNSNKIDLPSNTRNFSLGLNYGIYDFKFKIKNFFRKFLLRELTNQYKVASHWYATLQQLNYKEFFSLLEMPDTFYSWCKVVELHVWMLLVRLQQDQSCSSKARTIVIKYMWEEIEFRARAHAPTNVDFKKNMTQIYEDFRMKLFSYDEAFLIDDKALASSLWCYFFNKNCDDPRKLEALVSFIRYQIDHLQFINNEDVQDLNSTKVVWKSLRDHMKNK